ncbi:MAG: hypothetical protein D6773_14360 [Alphaproteobacteria bacterium]|nr:MAG: hypothetical protein D6773_14360 [Alphaproteobacteria bacterium]
MTRDKRKIEIFSAGCCLCDEVVRQIRDAACPACDIQVLDMQEPAARQRAAELGIRSLPAVVIEGRLADCCAGRAVDMNVLRSAGLGRPVGS